MSEGGVRRSFNNLTQSTYLTAPPNQACSSTAGRGILQRLITEWNIQSRGHGCEVCGRTFADKESYHTLLVDEKPDFRRSDVCATCWPAKFADAPIARRVSFPIGRAFMRPRRRVTEAIQKDTAETLLRKLIEQNDPAPRPRRLHPRRHARTQTHLQGEGTDSSATASAFSFTNIPRPATSSPSPIPNLRLDQLEDVQRDVAALLEHGLNPPAPPSAENAAAAAATRSRSDGARSRRSRRNQSGLAGCPCRKSRN